MLRLKAFISYSIKQKEIGGRFKHCLENYCGYDVFVAHTDMPPASNFQEEIINEINNTDFFIPLLSSDFKISDYSDQETGVALALDKKMLPIKLSHVNPYGFISLIQALQYREAPDYQYTQDNIKELALTIAQIGLIEEKFHSKAIDSLIYAFCNSNSYESTNTTIQILLKYDQLTQIHIEKIITAIKNNWNIQGAYGLPKLKIFLQNKYNISVD